MARTDHDRALALAGIFQAASIVCDIARRGMTDAGDLETCLGSLLKVDARDCADVFGGEARVRTGLRLVSEQLTRPSNPELARYAVALLVLERKVARRPALLEGIRMGIAEVGDKLQHFPLAHENIVASLAHVYQQTVSTIRPRIMVKGEQSHLARPGNADRIRAVLLAGIRAAVLWRQCGGGRFTLLLRRRPLVAAANRILAGLDH